MVDEQEPAKRVVKRVVKKTVVRPASPVASPTRVRYGRTVATEAKPRAQAKVQARPAGKAPATKVPAARQRIDLRSKASTVRERAGHAWRTVADGLGSGARTTGGFVATKARSLAAWRLPHLNPYLAAAITGAVVGIVAVVLGIAALSIFDAVRGVSSGGGLWGGLTLAGIAVAAGFLGAGLLRGFGSASGLLISFLAVVLTIIAILGVFLDSADTWVALPLVPLLGIAAFTLSRWLIDIAETTPPEID